MPLPIAHGLLGASVAAALRPSSQPPTLKTLLIGALLAISPDADYILNWMRISFGGWHHGFTHSIPFALLVGLLIITVLRDWKVRSFIVFTAAYASHTLLDFLITTSRGVALWWPFTDYRYKLRLQNPINYTWSDASLLETIVDVLKLCLAELVIFGPVFLLVVYLRHILAKRSSSRLSAAT